MKFNNLIFYSRFLMAAGIIVSCEDFISVDPPKTQITTSTVYNSDETALSAIRGIYSSMSSSGGFASGGSTSITLFCGTSADELTEFSNDNYRMEFNSNSLSPENPFLTSSLWQEGYKYIYYANSVIEGLRQSDGVTDSVERQLEGEAMFVRAFCHFYLTNLFGDIPVVTTTDYRVNQMKSRVTQAEVYQQIVADLVNAKILLAEDYSYSSGRRVRPNKWAATAFLARVYLYTNDWHKAEEESTAVINHTSLFGIENDFNKIFLRESREAIWQLQPVNADRITNEAQTFILTETPTFVALTSVLLNDFENNDLRFVHWIGSVSVGTSVYYFPYKYKVKQNLGTIEYSAIFRLAEQYLIRAESRAHQGKLTEAILDVDVIRGRAGLPLIQNINPEMGRESLLIAIEKERRIEFFSEWGHRWLDLKRTNRASVVLQSLKAPNWSPTDALYPIPKIEMQNAPNLLPQNEGY